MVGGKTRLWNLAKVERVTGKRKIKRTPTPTDGIKIMNALSYLNTDDKWSDIKAFIDATGYSLKSWEVSILWDLLQYIKVKRDELQKQHEKQSSTNKQRA